MLNLQDLSIEEKIGQMMMVGLNGNSINDKIKTLILKYKIGGVVLYRKNFNNYDDMLNLVKELKALNSQNKIPLFIAIDQEGGRVNRMPKEFKNLPAPYKISKTGNIELIKEAAKITGEMLFKSGINMNLAPVLDIKRSIDNHPIGDRCYGETKEDVVKYGISAMNEMQNQKIVSVVKHFPGHGLTNKDSHFLLPMVRTKSIDIENIDMLPFEQAIKNGSDAIMVGHMMIKNETGVMPASLSRKFIGKYLRKKLKFNGLVITDDLKMRAISFVYGYKMAIKYAFISGSDIVVFRFDHKNEQKALNQVYDMIKSKQLKEHKINRSVRRILKIKEKYQISDTQEFSGANVEEINKRIETIRQAVQL